MKKLYLVILILFVVINAYSADIIRYVNTDSNGGDGTTPAKTGANAAYASLQAWEAAEDTDLTDNGGDIMYVYCAGTTTDSNHCIVDGWTTDINSYIVITSSENARHDGISSSGVGYHITSDNQYRHTISILEQYTIVEWLVLSHSIAGGNVACFNGGVDNITFRNNIIAESIPNHAAVKFVGSGTSYIYNNIVSSSTVGQGIYVEDAGSPATEIYNNTVYNIDSNIGIGFSDATNNGIVKNNLVISPTGGDCYSVGNATVLTNGSSDATGSVGLQSLTTSEFVSVVIGSEDFHLVNGATSIDVGTDLGTTPSGVEIDIDMRNRDAEGDTWDLGADENVSGGGGGGGASDAPPNRGSVIYFMNSNSD
jgi:hypothetical protein